MCFLGNPQTSSGLFVTTIALLIVITILHPLINKFDET